MITKHTTLSLAAHALISTLGIGPTVSPPRHSITTRKTLAEHKEALAKADAKRARRRVREQELQRRLQERHGAIAD